jgi:deoxynucleoside triphosphate triphosphohydrolase SAMHD1
LDLERRIADESSRIIEQLRMRSACSLSGSPLVFFIPLPEHGALSSSCAIMTHAGDVESSGDYSRAAQLVSAKEIGRSIGFVTCEPEWAEVVFLASQAVLYDYFGNDIGVTDLNLKFESRGGDELQEEDEPGGKVLRLKAMKRFHVAEHLAVRRCRLDGDKLASYRSQLSQSGYYDRKPRLATPEFLTARIAKIAKSFSEFSGQHGWNVAEETVRQFLNQFPPRFRESATALIESFNFLNRREVHRLLAKAIGDAVADARRKKQPDLTVHVVPLAGTSAHIVLELLRQEDRARLKALGFKDYHSIHEMLGVAKPGDVVVFVDDNVSSGTQFSAQLLRWVGLQEASPSAAVRAEDGIESFELSPNARKLLAQLDLRLATCVGKSESEGSVRKLLESAGRALSFGGLRFGKALAEPGTAPLESGFRKYLDDVGTQCLRYVRGPDADEMTCRTDSLGYGGSEGRTVTLLNVPTSTYTAFWCPGIVDGEPWFPLFIRRGYAEKLVVA